MNCDTDARIAREVMGWAELAPGVLFADGVGVTRYCGPPGIAPRTPHRTFRPSADVADAWEVAELLRLQVEPDGEGWRATWDARGSWVVGRAPTAAGAISACAVGFADAKKRGVRPGAN